MGKYLDPAGDALVLGAGFGPGEVLIRTERPGRDFVQGPVVSLSREQVVALVAELSAFVGGLEPKRDGLDCCACGCKYWVGGACVDCGSTEVAE